MATVYLRDLRALRRALEAFGKEGEEVVVGGLVKAARFGATAVQRTASRTSPRPLASQTYQRSWLVNKLDDGAALSNSAAHAYFVEVGRLPSPGRPPPKAPILEWIYQKRLAKRPRPKGSKPGPAEPKPPEKTGPVNGPKTKRPKRNKKQPTVDADAFAEAIRWKIAARGFPGRFVLERTMPAIAKRTAREVKLAMNKLTRKPPRS